MSLWKAEQEIEIPKSFDNWRAMSHGELNAAFAASPEVFRDVVWKFVKRTEGNIQMFLSYREGISPFTGRKLEESFDGEEAKT